MERKFHDIHSQGNRAKGSFDGEKKTRTEQPTQMLRPIDIAHPFPSLEPLPPAVHRRADLVILLPLEPVQQDPAEALLEIILHPHDHFFEQIGLRGAEAAAALGLVEVGVEDAVDRVRRGQRDQGEGFGDVFPVVHKDGFEVVREGEADGGAGEEGVFL